MKKRISTKLVIIIFLILTVASAQQGNERRRSLRTDDSLTRSEQRSYRVHEQPIIYQRGKLYGLRNHKINTAHYVNISKMDDKLVKVYGEANPSKTDEHLLDVETNTQIIRDYIAPSRLSKAKLSGGSIHELSPSGYGPPAEQPKVADDQAEIATEMQESLHPDVENPYDGVPEAEQRAIAKISATSNAKEENKLSIITTTEQAIVPSEAVISTTESEERFRKTEKGITESDLSAAELRENSEASSTEGMVATDERSIETVTELNEASIDGQEGDTVLSTGYGASTEQFESRSISAETVGIPTSEGIKIGDEDRIGGYEIGDESVGTEEMPNTEVQEIPNKDTEFTLSESTTESSINDGITKTQIKSVSLETGAKDFGYETPLETLKESSTISQHLSEIESTITSGVEETAYSTMTSTIIAERTKYIEQSDQSTEAPDLSPKGVYPLQETIKETQISGDSDESETNANQNLEQSTSFEAEMSTDKSTLATVEVATELFTSSITSGTPASIFHARTEGDKMVTSSVIESAEGVPGYGTFSEPEISKAGLPGLNREAASQLAKSIEEATMLSRSTEETEMTSEKASEGMVTESEDLKSSAKLVPSRIEVSETTGFFKEASPIPAEQLSGYDAVVPEYTVEHTEATELQKINEGTEVPFIIPYNFEADSTEEKAISSEITATSSEAFTVAGFIENGATELSSESKEETIASEGMMLVEETTEISKSGEKLSGYGEMLNSAESNTKANSKTTELQKIDEEEASESSERSSILSQTEFTKTETGPSVQVSSTETLKESGITATEILEKTTQPSEWEAKTNGFPSMIPEKPINYNEEILTSEMSIKETKFDSVTRAFEQTISRETAVSDMDYGSEEQPSGYGESLEATDDSHELSKETLLITTETTTKFSLDDGTRTTERIASSEIKRTESSLSDESFEQATVHLTSSQDDAASETAGETASTSISKSVYTDARTGAEDFGYGGRGEEVISEKEYPGDTTTLAKEVLISSTTVKAPDESFEQVATRLTSGQDVAASETAGETASTSIAKSVYTDARTGAEDFGYGGRGEEAISEKEYPGDTTTLAKEVLISSTTVKAPDESFEQVATRLTSSQDVAASETAGETASTSIAKNVYTDARTGAEDFGYGGRGEEAISEKEYPGKTTTLVKKVLISSTITSAEERIENLDLIKSTELSESTEASKSTGEEIDSTEKISVTESTEQFVSIEAENGLGDSVAGNLSDYYPMTEAITNELSLSDEKLTAPQETRESTSVSTPNKIASADEGTLSLASQTAESVITGHTVAEETKFTEMPISETASVQIESKKISSDTNDFGYGERLEVVTEASLIGKTQDFKTSMVVAEPTSETGKEFILEKTTESVQQPLATAISPVESNIMISSETIDSATESKISDETALLRKLPELSELNVGDTATPSSIETIGASNATGSTLMHIVTSEIDIPVSYGEEAPQIIGLTKVMKTGPSIITADIAAAVTATTEGAKKEIEATGTETQTKSSLETIGELDVESTKFEETSEVRNGMDTISSEASLATSLEELVTTTAKIIELASITARMPMGPEDFGYGGENEQTFSSLIIPDKGSATIAMLELPSKQYSHIETSIIPESSISRESAGYGTFSEATSKSSEEYSSATFSSVASEAVAESVTQKLLTVQGESITKEGIYDEKDIPSKIPTGPEDFGYGENAQERNDAVSNPRVYAKEQQQFDRPLIVASNTASSNTPLKKIGDLSKRKWKPFTINCNLEVDEKGDLCRDWSRAGLCDTHRPTMFLFCRRTCLCIGPPMDLAK